MKIKLCQPNTDGQKEIVSTNFDTLADKFKKIKKLAIIGVGSELMQDDKAGIDISLHLEKKYGNDNPKVRIFTGYTTPENFTKEIADFCPDQIIIVDAADLNLLPGEFTELPVERITDFSLGTHKLSLVMMIRFLKETINPDFRVLAIQYKSIIFGEKMTKEMKAGVRKVIVLLSNIIESL